MTELIRSRCYDFLSEEEKKACCNGCGTKGLGGWLVPDTLYGLSITEACNIHDYDYSIGTCEEDKRAADERFLRNMYLIIDAESCGLLRGLRRMRARKYYKAVKYLGGGAFGNA